MISGIRFARRKLRLVLIFASRQSIGSHCSTMFSVNSAVVHAHGVQICPLWSSRLDTVVYRMRVGNTRACGEVWHRFFFPSCIPSRQIRGDGGFMLPAARAQHDVMGKKSPNSVISQLATGLMGMNTAVFGVAFLRDARRCHTYGRFWRYA